ncbi:hypothetical protein RI367_006001 [Sorochytrium milnesiophthora]
MNAAEVIAAQHIDNINANNQPVMERVVSYDADILIHEHAEVVQRPVDDVSDADLDAEADMPVKALPVHEPWTIQLDSIKNFILRPLKALKHEAVDEPVEAVKEGLLTTAHKVHDVAASAQHTLEDELRRGIQAGERLVADSKYNIEHAVDTGKMIAEDLAERASESVTHAKDNIKRTVDDTLHKIHDLPKVVQTGVKREAHHLEDKYKLAQEVLRDATKDALNKGQKAVEKGRDAVDDALEKGRDTVDDVLEKGREVVDEAAHKLEEKRDQVKDQLNVVFEKLREPVKKVLDGGRKHGVIVRPGESGYDYTTGGALQDDVRELMDRLKRTTEDLDQVKESAQRAMWDAERLGGNTRRPRPAGVPVLDNPKNPSPAQAEAMVRSALQGYSPSEKLAILKRSNLFGLAAHPATGVPPHGPVPPVSSLLASLLGERSAALGLTSTLPITALFSLLLGLYYIHISRKLYRARARTNIWIGDGQFQLYKLLQERPNGSASSGHVAKHSLFSLLKGVQLRDSLMTAMPLVMLLGLTELMGAAPALVLAMYAALAAGQFLLAVGTNDEIQQLEINLDMVQDVGGPLVSHVSTSRKMANTIYYTLYMTGFAWMALNVFF